MKKLFYFTLILFSLFTSCNDDDNQNPNILPETTQIGANTGGALIDGKVWVAKKEFPDLNPGGNNTEYTQYRLKIVLNSLDSKGRVFLEIKNNTELSIGVYTLNSASFSDGKSLYHTDLSNIKGSITITKFDKKNKFVSGTFHFEAGTSNGDGTKVVVTEGRFDKEFF